jgi:plasmid stabilization system protein ParE
MSRINGAVDHLETFPRLGRMVPDFHHDALRELIVGDYRIIYRIVDDELRILTVVHGSRDLMLHLPDGPWDIE